MKSEIYPALKEFEEKLYRAFPEAAFEIEAPFEDEDLSLEIYLPVSGPKVNRKIAGFLVDLEEKYGVDFEYMLLLKEGASVERSLGSVKCKV